MQKALPSREQVQSWILGIEPSDYFERLVERPGLLLLRAKDPVCDWRGLHLATSDSWRKNLLHDLALLKAGQQQLQYRASLPDGRAWFNLYTSRVDFGSWWELIITHDALSPDRAVRVRFVHSTVHVSLPSQAIETMVAELGNLPHGGIKSQLPLVREVRSSSPPQALWFWHWPERRSDA